MGAGLVPEIVVAADRPDERAGPRPVIDEMGMVLVPITKSELPREIGVPETVMAALPSKTSVPSMARPLGYAVKVSLSMTKVDGEPGITDWPESARGVAGAEIVLVVVIAIFGTGVANANLNEPMARLPEASESTVPFSVMAGPDTESVAPSMEIAVPPRGMKVSLEAVRAPDGPSLEPEPEVASRNVDMPMVRVADGLME